VWVKGNTVRSLTTRAIPQRFCEEVASSPLTFYQACIKSANIAVKHKNANMHAGRRLGWRPTITLCHAVKDEITISLTLAGNDYCREDDVSMTAVCSASQ